MKIIALGGSPKGPLSITRQYVDFLKQEFRPPRYEIEMHDVAKSIGRLERDEADFEEVIEAVSAADGVLWAFPLYFWLVPSQYKRFIELIFERGAEEAFRGKHAAVLSTSIKFNDHTAHQYMRGICEDLQMEFLGAYSADMYDLLRRRERARLKRFGKEVFDGIERKAPGLARWTAPIVHDPRAYRPEQTIEVVDPGSQRVVILSDAPGNSLTNHGRMVERLDAIFAGKATLIDISALMERCGCTCCLRCGKDNICLYEGKDLFTSTYRDKISTADVIVYTGTVVDRYLSSTWKMFFDRSFFNTHIPSVEGKQVALVVSGPMRQVPNLRQIFESYFEVQGAHLVDVVTDEDGDSALLDGRLQGLADRLVRYARVGYIRPRTFLGIAGRKLFRDDVWGRLRPAFPADHRYYKRHGLYDFPMLDAKNVSLNVMLPFLMRIPSFRRNFEGRNFNRFMLKPFESVFSKRKRRGA
jgi:multimeric flavodoxin WrbA